METIELCKAKLNKTLFQDILFFMFAEGGAMGEHGAMNFIREDGKCYHFNYIYGDIRLQDLMDYDAVPYSNNWNREDWGGVNLGFGNWLYVKKEVYPAFYQRIKDYQSKGAIYASWIAHAEEILEERKGENWQMDKTLWRQAEKCLSLYGGDIFCKLRFAQEKQALKNTNAIRTFSVLAKMQAAAAAQNSYITVDGVINSSFVAWLMGATKVNPLAPHYHCPVCGKIRFDGSVRTGWDLMPKQCDCGAPFIRDGHNIPVEGFAKYAQTCPMGASVRVSTAFYPVAVQILKEAFPDEDILPARISLHDGGWVEAYLMGVSSPPKLEDDGFWHTDLKGYLKQARPVLDFEIRINKKLDDLEGKALPAISDIATPALAQTLYGQKKEAYAFITDQLDEAVTVDFDLLMQLEGFAHSTGAWKENGEHLVKADVADVRELPAYRERIWEDMTTAFGEDATGVLEIMENTRKGRYYADGLPEEDRVFLLAYDLPEWYPWFLTRVQYLCPKGHVASLLQRDLLYCWYQQQA